MYYVTLGGWTKVLIGLRGMPMQSVWVHAINDFLLISFLCSRDEVILIDKFFSFT